MFAKSTNLVNSFCIYYFIVATCYPAIFEIIHIPSYTGAVILICLNVLFVNPSILREKPFFWMFFNAVVLFVFLNTGAYFHIFPIGHEISNTLNVFFNAAILFEWILYTQSIAKIKSILNVFSIILIVKCFFCIKVEINHPGINRELFVVADDYNYFGRLNFGTIFALPALASSMLFLVKFSDKFQSKLIYGSLSILFIAASVYASRVTGLIFTLFLFLVVLFLNVKSRNLNKVLYPIGLVFGLILLFQNQILDVMEKSNLEIIHLKALDMKESLTDKEATGDVYERTSRYEKSLKAFIESPLVGANNRKETIGGHSFWLDHLGGLGILGTIPAVLTLVFMYMRVKQILPKQFKNIYLLLFVTNMVILFFNPFADDDTFVWLFVFIPFSFVIADYNESKHNQMIAQ